MNVTCNDLVASRVTAPRLSTNLSIPGLLNAMQNEWDELMLETFQLKQVRQHIIRC